MFREKQKRTKSQCHASLGACSFIAHDVKCKISRVSITQVTGVTWHIMTHHDTQSHDTTRHVQLRQAALKLWKVRLAQAAAFCENQVPRVLLAIRNPLGSYWHQFLQSNPNL
jgi:hypothetical protein